MGQFAASYIKDFTFPEIISPIKPVHKVEPIGSLYLHYLDSSPYTYNGEECKDIDLETFIIGNSKYTVVVNGSLKEEHLQEVMQALNMSYMPSSSAMYTLCYLFHEFQTERLYTTIQESKISCSFVIVKHGGDGGWDTMTVGSLNGVPLYMDNDGIYSYKCDALHVCNKIIKVSDINEIFEKPYTISDNVVLPFSGGLESTTCLHYACNNEAYKDKTKHCVFFTFNQNNVLPEAEAVVNIVDHYRALGHNIIVHTIPITYLDKLNANSGLFSGDITKSVFVPARNLQFMSIVAAYCASIESNTIIVGFNQESLGSFNDDTPYFGEAFERMCQVMGQFIKVDMPLAYLNKHETVALADEWGVPRDKIWYCHFPQTTDDGFVPCGKCKACQYYGAAKE